MTSPADTESAELSGQSHIEEALAFLRLLPVFRDTPLDILKLYAYLSRKEEFRKNEIILRPGTPSDRMLLIMDGEVAISHQHGDRLILLQILTADRLNYFGELALVAEFDWFFCATAHTDVSLLSISRESFRRIMERYPERYMGAVAKIVRLRIDRFVGQTNYLLGQMDQATLEQLTIRGIDPTDITG